MVNDVASLYKHLLPNVCGCCVSCGFVVDVCFISDVHCFLTLAHHLQILLIFGGLVPLLKINSDMYNSEKGPLSVWVEICLSWRINNDSIFKSRCWPKCLSGYLYVLELNFYFTQKCIHTWFLFNETYREEKVFKSIFHSLR